MRKTFVFFNALSLSTYAFQGIWPPYLFLGRMEAYIEEPSPFDEEDRADASSGEERCVAQKTIGSQNRIRNGTHNLLRLYQDRLSHSLAQAKALHIDTITYVHDVKDLLLKKSTHSYVLVGRWVYNVKSDILTGTFQLTLYSTRDKRTSRDSAADPLPVSTLSLTASVRLDQAQQFEQAYKKMMDQVLIRLDQTLSNPN